MDNGSGQTECEIGKLIKALDAIPSGDPTSAHKRADEILVRALKMFSSRSNDLAEAWERCRDRVDTKIRKFTKREIRQLARDHGMSEFAAREMLAIEHAGHSRKNPDALLNVDLGVLVTAEQKRLIVQAASLDGLDMASWARSVLYREAVERISNALSHERMAEQNQEPA